MQIIDGSDQTLKKKGKAYGTIGAKSRLEKLNAEKTAQQKLEKDIKEVQHRTEEFQKIMERVKKIDDLVEFIEDNTNEMA